MIAHPPPPDPTALARALLCAAAEVEAAEANIKRAILDAARAGDCARIIAIVEPWIGPSIAIPPQAIPPAMLDANQVAAMLVCSVRTVRRMTDGGQLPAPTRLGALIRWPRELIDAWIRDGCKPVRRARSST